MGDANGDEHRHSNNTGGDNGSMFIRDSEDGGFRGGGGDIAQQPGGKNESNRDGSMDDPTTCRDYLKGICNRGSRCKFKHPADAQVPEPRDDMMKFCNDFQNPRGCNRDSCKFAHAHKEDVERYRRSGEVTPGLARAIAAVTNKDNINGIPFCKEFQNGKCSRGQGRCRYWHIIPSDERRRRHGGGGGGSRSYNDDYDDYPAPAPDRRRARAWSPGPAQPRAARYGDDGYGPGIIYNPSVPYDPYLADAKRPRYDSTADYPAPATSPRYTQEMERKNTELRVEVDTLKRELARERERYEDLYSLFRQQQQTQQAVVQAQVQQTQQQVQHQQAQQQQQAPVVAASYASGVQSQQPVVMSSSSAPVYPSPAPYAAAAAATELVSLAQAVSSMAQSANAMAQSRVSAPGDVNVQWSSAVPPTTHWAGIN